MSACAQRHDSAKSSGVNSSTDGMTGASVGREERRPRRSASAGGRRSRRRAGRRARGSRGRGPGARRIGWMFSRSGGIARAASSGSGVVFAYWWASGWSGTVTPTIAPISGPQMPAAQTTMSAANSPWSVMTARDPAVVGPDAGHRVLPEEPGAALGRAAGLGLGARTALAARRSGRGSRRGRARGRAAARRRTHSSGSSTRPSIPHDVGEAVAAVQLARGGRRSSANSRPPTWRKHHARRG